MLLAGYHLLSLLRVQQTPSVLIWCLDRCLNHPDHFEWIQGKKTQTRHRTRKNSFNAACLKFVSCEWKTRHCGSVLEFWVENCHEKQNLEAITLNNNNNQKQRSYWCVSVHVAATADRGAPVVEVDGRQTLLWKAVAKAAAQAPRTLAAFCFMVVQRYLHTHTHSVDVNMTIKAIIRGQRFEPTHHINPFKGSDSWLYCSL